MKSAKNFSHHSQIKHFNFEEQKNLRLSLLVLRRVPTALEGGPSDRQHLLGVGREDSEWGRRTTKVVLPEDIEIWASLQPVI